MKTIWSTRADRRRRSGGESLRLERSTDHDAGRAGRSEHLSGETHDGRRRDPRLGLHGPHLCPLPGRAHDGRSIRRGRGRDAGARAGGRLRRRARAGRRGAAGAGRRRRGHPREPAFAAPAAGGRGRARRQARLHREADGALGRRVRRDHRGDVRSRRRPDDQQGVALPGAAEDDEAAARRGRDRRAADALRAPHPPRVHPAQQGLAQRSGGGLALPRLGRARERPRALVLGRRRDPRAGRLPDVRPGTRICRSRRRRWSTCPWRAG